MAKQPELPIVGYAQLAAAMQATPEAGLESASVIKTSAEVSKAEVLVHISEAMSVLEQAQFQEGVFVAPDDRITSLVQSYPVLR